MELQDQFGAVELGDGPRHYLPGNISEDRVVRPAVIGHLHLAGCDDHVGLAPDKMSEDLLDISLLEDTEPLGRKRVKIADRRYDLTPRQPRKTNKFRHLKLPQKLNRQNGIRRFAAKMSPLHLCMGNTLRSLWNLRLLDGEPYLKAGASGKPGESLFRKTPLHRPDGAVRPIFREQLDDLACREFFLPPGADLPADPCDRLAARGAFLRNRFGKVELAGGKLMSQQAKYFVKIQNSHGRLDRGAAEQDK